MGRLGALPLVEKLVLMKENYWSKIAVTGFVTWFGLVLRHINFCTFFDGKSGLFI